MRAGAPVELATLSWVHWNGNERLHGYLADIPPIEYEKAHDDQPATTRWRLGSQEASHQIQDGPDDARASGPVLCLRRADNKTHAYDQPE